MLYTEEDLPRVMEEIKAYIHSLNLNPANFEITKKHLDNSIRVASYTANGGFMVRVYGTNDLERCFNEIRELYANQI
jgi:hypothetical protein